MAKKQIRVYHVADDPHGLGYIVVEDRAPKSLQRGYRLRGRFKPIYHPRERGSYRFWRRSFAREGLRGGGFTAGQFDQKSFVSAGGFKWNIPARAD